MIKIDLWVNKDLTVKLLINTSITRKLDFKRNRHKEKLQICGGEMRGNCWNRMDLYQHTLS